MIRSPRQKKEERKALRMLFLVSQIGICMMVPVFFCVFLGQWVSEKTGLPLLFPLMLLVGILAGFRSCWQVIGRFTDIRGKSDKSGRPDKASIENGREDPYRLDKASIENGREDPYRLDIEDEWDELDRPDRPVP